MSSEMVLEQRLVAVERAISEIQHQLTGGTISSDWLGEVAGSVTDEAAFKEALRLGREACSSDRHTGESETHP